MLYNKKIKQDVLLLQNIFREAMKCINVIRSLYEYIYIYIIRTYQLIGFSYLQIESQAYFNLNWSLFILLIAAQLFDGKFNILSLPKKERMLYMYYNHSQCTKTYRSEKLMMIILSISSPSFMYPRIKHFSTLWIRY